MKFSDIDVVRLVCAVACALVMAACDLGDAPAPADAGTADAAQANISPPAPAPSVTR